MYLPHKCLCTHTVKRRATSSTNLWNESQNSNSFGTNNWKEMGPLGVGAAGGFGSTSQEWEENRFFVVWEICSFQRFLFEVGCVWLFVCICVCLCVYLCVCVSAF